MRLLSRHDGRLQFTRSQPQRKPYAILSHRWLPEEEEVLYNDILSGDTAKPGYEKIEFCLNQAEKDGYNYVWIDTCCIQRSDSTELAESITSMFRWYREAAVCYVYLIDMKYEDRDHLAENQWFRRGWTLQELIAPDDVRFFSSDRQYLGDKTTLASAISIATNASKFSLDAPISERFTWSFGRETTKPEDTSYCMIGLLGVSLIPNYGEGAECAKRRLLEQIKEEYGRRTVEDINTRIKLQAVEDSSSPAKPGQHDCALDDDELLKLLRYDSMNLRRGAIQNPFADTCSWLIEHELYRSWVGMTSHRFLCIKGNLGTGKSTLIKFADLSQTQGVNVSFYFKAHATELERSAAGMYRSLLFQILQHESALRPVVLGQLRQEVMYTGRLVLSLSSLQDALKRAAVELKQPIRCFIDAIDECNDGEAQDILHYLRELSRQSPFFVCISTRYYPAIQLQSPEIFLEKQEEHDRDVQEYVNGSLLGNDELKQEVIRKAKGVFLWAVLVVRQLNAQSSSEQEWTFARILDSPDEELVDILEKVTSRDDNLPRFRFCMQWILCSIGQPISLDVFYVGVLLSLKESGVGGLDSAIESALEDREDPEQMKKCVTVWSRGLAETVQGFWIGTFLVQTIHESVRSLCLLNPGRLRLISDLHTDPECQMHDAIKRACRLSLDINFASSISDAQTMPVFYRYVIGHIFEHADKAAPCVSQEDFIRNFALTSYRRMADDYPSHGCDAIWYCFVESKATKLILTAKEMGMSPRFVEDERGCTILTRAIRLEMDEVVQALLACDPDLELQDEDGWTALHIASATSLDLTKKLLQCGANPNAQNVRGWTPLHTVIVANYCLDEPYFSGIDDLSSIQPNTGNFEHTSLFTSTKRFASETGTSIIKLLLAHSADVKAPASDGRTALMFAALTGCTKTMELLLAAGADVEDYEYPAHSVLIEASAAGQVQSVSRLLPAYANLEARQHRINKALLAACKHEGFHMAHGHARAAIQLQKRLQSREVFRGEDIDPRCFEAVHPCDTAIVRLLLNAGADPNASDDQKRTPLSIVCTKYGGFVLAKVLLENGANPNAKDHRGMTPLRIASDYGRDDVAILLIRKGADFTITDNAGVRVITSIMKRSTSLRFLLTALERSALLDEKQILAAFNATMMRYKLVPSKKRRRSVC